MWSPTASQPTGPQQNSRALLQTVRLLLSGSFSLSLSLLSAPPHAECIPSVSLCTHKICRYAHPAKPPTHMPLSPFLAMQGPTSRSNRLFLCCHYRCGVRWEWKWSRMPGTNLSWNLLWNMFTTDSRSPIADRLSPTGYHGSWQDAILIQDSMGERSRIAEVGKKTPRIMAK